MMSDWKDGVYKNKRHIHLHLISESQAVIKIADWVNVPPCELSVEMTRRDAQRVRTQ